ncbi:hypothetical protein PHYSODRAFT_307892 [Phytophthora sojae]|uniref:SWIM-type domain-containing protein n=1 Tax=Phytophthora sojae (strain P6497) TaxID=1094619 RepID=G5AGR8_PHYSP|nr:hypothetical protein PHYSODRAFT_307892 [Phytophthora sojae]EGZ05348.1 hypothetical protein PHYSODRAFT_307892 [Phytophthora sojae]|eukprot:XP_009539269.1 hypothetical protein PHYSODRAFT_307892 [Phytophthora sojae]
MGRINSHFQKDLLRSLHQNLKRVKSQLSRIPVRGLSKYQLAPALTRSCSRTRTLWGQLRKSYSALGIECSYLSDSDGIDAHFQYVFGLDCKSELSQHLIWKDLVSVVEVSERPGLVSGAGVTTEALSAFYSACDKYAKLKPWNCLSPNARPFRWTLWGGRAAAGCASPGHWKDHKVSCTPPGDAANGAGEHKIMWGAKEMSILYDPQTGVLQGDRSVPDVTDLAWLARALNAQNKIRKVELRCKTFGFDDELVIRNSTALTMQDVERLWKVIKKQQEGGETIAEGEAKKRPRGYRRKQIEQIRALFRCDCKKFWANGWICSHVVAAMARKKQFVLSVVMATLPTTMLSGGQRKIPGALYADDPNNRTLTVPSLIRRMMKQPHFYYPHGWKIAKEMTMEINGEEEELFAVGKIRSYSQNGGIYKWLVVFEHGVNEFFEFEELAQLIVSSRQSGLDVACSAVPPGRHYRGHHRGELTHKCLSATPDSEYVLSIHIAHHS